MKRVLAQCRAVVIWRPRTIEFAIAGCVIEFRDVSSPASKSRVRLGTILALIVLVTTVPLAGLAGQLIFTSWRHQQALINGQNEERARAIAGSIDQEVQNTVAQLRIISALEPIDAEDLRSFHEVAGRLLATRTGSNWESMRLVSTAGGVLTDTGAPFGTPMSLVSDDWVRAILTTRQYAVSRVHKDPTTGAYFVSIGVYRLAYRSSATSVCDSYWACGCSSASLPKCCSNSRRRPAVYSRCSIRT
jgi:hypothetical protein